MVDNIQTTGLNWQPIETAPRDCSWFLGSRLASGNHNNTCTWWVGTFVFSNRYDPTPQQIMQDSGLRIIEGDTMPTHWAPLPPAILENG